jgi:hypothetical protein
VAAAAGLHVLISATGRSGVCHLGWLSGVAKSAPLGRVSCWAIPAFGGIGATVQFVRGCHCQLYAKCINLHRVVALQAMGSRGVRQEAFWPRACGIQLGLCGCVDAVIAKRVWVGGTANRRTRGFQTYTVTAQRARMTVQGIHRAVYVHGASCHVGFCAWV